MVSQIRNQTQIHLQYICHEAVVLVIGKEIGKEDYDACQLGGYAVV
jgi:hypothetical protein